MAFPTLLLIFVTALFLAAERLFPGRDLPHCSGWYLRSISINLVQLTITFLIGGLWVSLLGDQAALNLSKLHSPVLEGFLGWFVGTFVFYWWHRLRHRNGFWHIFHQIHHSASRIEVLTSFYKHPIEILANSLLTAIVLFPLLGVSVMAIFWYNLYAATGEYFYHANVKTPHSLRYFIQTPELHSIHHQYEVHQYNFSDIPLWDRIFGTYLDTVGFTDRCGFADGAEQRIVDMLMFRDVNDAETV